MTRFRYGILAFFCAAGIVVGSYLIWFSSAPSDPLFGWKFPADKFPSLASRGTRITFSNSSAHSDVRTPGGIPEGLPVRLEIPALGVDAAVEDAVITAQGRMDMPTGSVDVAWFSLGPPPGQVGSAVIGGHFGIRDGVPFVFYRLDTLKTGDRVYIQNDKGETLAFEVRTISLFDRNADATTVFTSADGLAHLNLVTCEGVWNKVNDSYPQRRVVFADAVPTENVATALTTPLPTPRSTAVPTPRETQLLMATVLPTIAATPIPTPVESTLRSLYDTPIRGLVSSFLMVSIIVMVYLLVTHKKT